MSSHLKSFPGGSDGKASAYNARDLGLIPGLGRSPGEGNDNPPKHSCWRIPWTGKTWRAIVHGVANSRTLRQQQQTMLNDFILTSSQVTLVVKNPPANARDIRDMGSIPGSGRSPGEGNGNPF